MRLGKAQSSRDSFTIPWSLREIPPVEKATLQRIDFGWKAESGRSRVGSSSLDRGNYRSRRRPRGGARSLRDGQPNTAVVGLGAEKRLRCRRLKTSGVMPNPESLITITPQPPASHRVENSIVPDPDGRASRAFWMR